MGQFEREIAGALKNTINAHGPIDLDHVPSAAKRIKHALREAMKRERDAIAATTPRRVTPGSPPRPLGRPTT